MFAHALEYALSIHLPPMARPVASLPPPEREGQVEWGSPGLGVRAAEWRPGGGWLAVAGWDGKVSWAARRPASKVQADNRSQPAQIRLLDDREWSTILTLDPLRSTPLNAVSRNARHTFGRKADICAPVAHQNVWQEPPDWIESTMNRGIIPCAPSSARLKYEQPLTNDRAGLLTPCLSQSILSLHRRPSLTFAQTPKRRRPSWASRCSSGTSTAPFSSSSMPTHLASYSFTPSLSNEARRTRASPSCS
jgi:hypothetical protein